MKDRPKELQMIAQYTDDLTVKYLNIEKRFEKACEMLGHLVGSHPYIDKHERNSGSFSEAWEKYFTNKDED